MDEVASTGAESPREENACPRPHHGRLPRLPAVHLFPAPRSREDVGRPASSRTRLRSRALLAIHDGVGTAGEIQTAQDPESAAAHAPALHWRF